MRYGGHEGEYGGYGKLIANPIFTGVASFASGSVSAPSIYLGQANNGFYSRYSGSVNVSVNGTDTVEFGPATGEGVKLNNAAELNWASSGISGAPDASVGRAAANSLIFGAGTAAAGAVTSRTEINKAVTAFTDAAAKATFTVTIPNAQHNATLEVEFTGVIGAGGAIGAGEASATNSYKINISRTAGVNAVAVASSAFGAATAAVSGATTVTCTAAVSAISGAVDATNTFTVNVTITKGGGASDNHTCLCYAKLMNANATGITIA